MLRPAFFALALLASPAFGAGLLVLGGTKVQGSRQGNAQFAAAGVFFEKPLSHRVDARLEIFPALVFRERSRPETAGPAGNSTVVASAACLLARYRWHESEKSSFFVEGGAGPLYAYSRPVPSGGTRGNFFDELGVGVTRNRLSCLLRFVHVSNANIGPQRHRGNPGVSFATAGVGWSFG